MTASAITATMSSLLPMGEDELRAYLKKIGMDDGFEERIEEMKEDKSQWDEEDMLDEEFMLGQERAFMPEGPEKDKVPKLDETNHLSYAFLRKSGNNWKYEPKKVHPKIRKRLYRRFDTFDKDSDGIMTIDEVLTWATRMKTLCQSSDEEVESVRNALKVFFLEKGCNGEGCRRENWVECNRVFAEAERERKKQGIKRYVDMLGDAYYDILDTDGDGFVSLPELKRMMNIFRVPEEAAYTFFACADVNKDGILDRQEMHDMFIKFWMSDEYYPELDGIFAYKY